MSRAFRIVIAEDEALVAEMIESILGDIGHTIVGRASNGYEAIEMTQRYQPTAVLMDIKMPDMDGLEAARRITVSCPTPVVILTAYETPELVHEASRAGIGAYLTKPPSARELDRALTIAVDRFAEMSELRQLNATLNTALLESGSLSGLISICAGCKKIRDEQGQWHLIEAYLQEHTAAEFSHGICPSCSASLYPGFRYDR